MNVKDMLNQLDYLYNTGDLKEAERRLDSWLEQALQTRNYAAALTFYNEMEGLYRTTGRSRQAADISDKALQLIEIMGLKNTVHHATTLLNGATANRWAQNLDKALDMYHQAADIYRSLDLKNSYVMASLYNNISHIYQQQNNHEKALDSLQTALNLVSNMEDSASEIATTKVAMSLSYMALGNMNAAKEAINAALAYYESDEGQSDGHYGSALSAMGEYYWRCEDYDNAIMTYEKALKVTRSRFGESDGCKVITRNMDIVRKEMEEKQQKG
ncbi:MAG: tetratricopeptide repeat protein [Oscillospiraceae bacterium]|nr:tetratricopeptide repeat protein [Oscillospiraceae bacterium]